MRSASGVLLALLCTAFPAVTESQTVTVQLTEQLGQPLQIQAEGSLTDLGIAASIGDGLQEFNNTFVGYGNGFFVVGPNKTYHGFRLIQTTSNLSGCQGFLDMGVFPMLEGAEEFPPLGFKDDDKTAIILPSGYYLGDPLEGTATIPGIRTLSDIGLEEGQVCSLEWEGLDSVQRIVLSAGIRQPFAQVARLELFEDRSGSLRLLSTGHLSDTTGLGEPVLNESTESQSSSVEFGPGFYVSNPGEDTNVFTLKDVKNNVRKCGGLAALGALTLQEGSTIPSFGFNVGSESVTISLPANYKAKDSLHGLATIANTSLADLNIAPGARCYVEWPTQSGIPQRLVLVAAKPLASTLYLEFENTIGFVEGVDYNVIDQGCTVFAQRVLDGHVYDAKCFVTQGTLFNETIEIQAVVTGATTKAGNIADRVRGTYDMSYFLGSDPLPEGSTVDPVKISDMPSTAFRLYGQHS